MYGPYIKSLKGWDSNRDGLSTPTTTLIGIRGPTKSRFFARISAYIKVYAEEKELLLKAREQVCINIDNLLHAISLEVAFG